MSRQLPTLVPAVALNLVCLLPMRAADKPVKVGEKAPAISLTDQDGNTRTLEELTKKARVAIVFHRSAQW